MQTKSTKTRLARKTSVSAGWSIALLAALAIGPALARPARAAGPDERPGPVLLFGADALDLELVRSGVAAGRLPHFAALMENGASGVLLSEREMRSPALWTTIATGRPRAVHGIYDFVTNSRFWPEKLRSKHRRLVTSRMRRSPALWNLASRADRRVVVVGWLNTWPAEPVAGVMVAPYVALGQRKQVTIKGAVYPDEARQVYPAERWAEISRLIVTPDEVPDELVDSFVPAPDGELARDLPILERYQRALRWSLANTLTTERILVHLLASERPDLAMCYFEGSDSLAHRFWLFREPPERIAARLAEAGYPTGQAEALAARYGRVIDRYYQMLDRILGEVQAAAGPGARLLVLSDHGFGPRSGRYPLNPEAPFTGEHQLEGSLLVGGAGVRPGRTIVGATLYDITPTVLELMGIDSRIPFEGRSLVPRLLVEDEDETARSDDQGEETDDVPFFEEEIERLRSLGYVE